VLERPDKLNRVLTIFDKYSCLFWGVRSYFGFSSSSATTLEATSAMSSPFSSEEAPPRSYQAILLPTLALFAVILDIPPLIWHARQRNVAAWSVIAWLIIINFFNFINPLIWPRDNLLEWYDGSVLCDIEVRFFVGFTVALASASTMVMRKLANVMDTRNITVTTGRRMRARETMLDLVFCWGYPILLMILYYIVQSSRYFIFAVTGCVAAYTSSWPSAIFISTFNVTMLVATYYAGEAP
jgi:pheromone a factor receptor